MSIATILLLILALALVGVLPAWPQCRGWECVPTGGIGLAVIILPVLLMTGLI
ncbi:MAG TPA: DUF3309 family protein [Rhodoferax sp.]